MFRTIHCPVFQCGNEYLAKNERTLCPRCGFSVYDTQDTNDPDELNLLLKLKREEAKKV
jgi:hypothetical protein